MSSVASVTFNTVYSTNTIIVTGGTGGIGGAAVAGVV